MKICTILMVALASATGPVAVAQRVQTAPGRNDVGKIEFESKCALCHGVSAKGDGPLAPYLNKAVADLTTLAKRNGGILPVAAMYEIIEGGKEIPAHGSRDMPAWGSAYRIPPGERDVPYDPEAYVRARILAIIEYVNRLQVK